MSEDLFAEWKRQRFIVAPSYAIEQDQHVVVLTDVGFWAEHVDELIEWCNENQALNQGMTVQLKDKESVLMFILRWS